MGEVIDLDSQRPHLVIPEMGSGNAHVIPVQLALNIANGSVGTDALPEGVWRTIMAQWLLELGV